MTNNNTEEKRTTRMTVPELYRHIEDQLVAKMKTEFSERAAQYQANDPSIPIDAATRLAAETHILMAFKAAVEQINRGSYSEETIDAVAELFGWIFNTTPENARNLLTYIRDTARANDQAKEKADRS